MLRWHLWLSTHLFSLGKCDATQFLHHIGRLATAPANLQPSSRLQPMHPWSPPQLGHPWALSSSGMWANMIKASVTTAHLSYRFPILKLPPPPCAVLLVWKYVERIFTPRCSFSYSISSSKVLGPIQAPKRKLFEQISGKRLRHVSQIKGPATHEFSTKKGHMIMTSWWLNQPIWKIFVKLDHFPK